MLPLTTNRKWHKRFRLVTKSTTLVVDFGTNRKRVCNFLLVINSNLVHILPRFRDIAGFLLRTTPPLFHPNLGVFPLDYIADVVAPRNENPKLIIRVINFELVYPVCPGYINLTDRRTDRRTNRRTDDLR